MAIKAALSTYLGTVTNLTAVVGTQIYPDLAPTKANAPFIVFTQIATTHAHHMTAAAGAAAATFQMDCWASTSAAADALAELLRQALQGYQQNTWGGVTVDGVFLTAERSGLEDPTDGSEQSLYRQSMDFVIHYRESVPTF